MNYLQKELYELIKSDPSIFEFLQEGSLDGIWYWDLENVESEWMSPRFWALFGYDPSEKKHLASEWQGMIDPEDLEIALDNFTKHCENPDHPYDQIVRYTHKDGSSVWVRCRGVAIRDSNGKPIRMLGAHNDVTQVKLQEQIIREQNEKLTRTQEKLIELSITDELTQLYNRRYFQTQFNFLIKSASRQNFPISLILLDIDHFKKYNDTYGHTEGDKILNSVGEILKKFARETDISARIGGEEFAVILPGTKKSESESACKRLKELFDSYTWPNRKVTASFGIASMQCGKDTQSRSWEYLYRKADEALYYAKEHGRDQLRHYDDIQLVSE
jgi:diguanylate cyclase (GGDEF)-like protein/PAS domain S-box-containing protein